MTTAQKQRTTPADMASAHPQYALLAYARDMHQYTLELWMELSKKLEDASGASPSVPATAPSSPSTSSSPSSETGAPVGSAKRGRQSSGSEGESPEEQ